MNSAIIESILEKLRMISYEYDLVNHYRLFKTSGTRMEAGKTIHVADVADNETMHHPNTYLISTAAEWNKFATIVNGGRFLRNETRVLLTGNIPTQNETNAKLATVGTQSNPFIGIFNGNDRRIRHEQGAQNDTVSGLFGVAQGATIKDLRVSGSIEDEIYLHTYNNRFGFVCNEATNTTFDGCAVVEFKYPRICQEQNQSQDPANYVKSNL